MACWQQEQHHGSFRIRRNVPGNDSQAFSIDVASEMGYSKPSVSRAMGLLRSGGYLIMEPDGKLTLTEKGRAVAETIYERHQILSSALIHLGVSPKTAMEDACRVEHYISDETFQAIKKQVLPLIKEEN